MTTRTEPKNYLVKSDVNELAAAILEVMEVAKDHDVECWLCYGALLGLVRDGRLLPWNNDAELGCWYVPRISDKFRSITDELNKRGYHTSYYSSIGSISVRQKGVQLNINCFWDDGKYAVRPHEEPSVHINPLIASNLLYWISLLLVTYPAGFLGTTLMPLSKNELAKIIFVSTFRILPKNIRKKLFLLFVRWSRQSGGVYQKTAISLEYFSGFIIHDFYGNKVLIPNNPEKLLEHIYGRHWRTPKVNWSFYDDDNKDDTGILFIDEMWDYTAMDVI